MRVEDTWAAMAGLVDDGLVRFIGVCNFTAELVERRERLRHVDAVQNQYWLLRRSEDAAMEGHCQRHGTAFLAYGPLALGLLTGRIDPVTSDSSTSWGRGKTVDRLRPIAARLKLPLAQLALAWVAQRDDSR